MDGCDSGFKFHLMLVVVCMIRFYAFDFNLEWPTSIITGILYNHEEGADSFGLHLRRADTGDRWVKGSRSSRRMYCIFLNGVQPKRRPVLSSLCLGVLVIHDENHASSLIADSISNGRRNIQQHLV
jgi:hypothetical protein